MAETALSAWLTSLIGRNNRFKSPRQLSLAAGLSQNVVLGIIERGTADPDTLIKIGRAAGKSPREMFELAGWLEPEPEGAARAQTPEEVQLLELWRGLPLHRRESYLLQMRAELDPERLRIYLETPFPGQERPRPTNDPRPL